MSVVPVEDRGSALVASAMRLQKPHRPLEYLAIEDTRMTSPLLLAATEGGPESDSGLMKGLSRWLRKLGIRKADALPIALTYGPLFVSNRRSIA